MPAGPGPMLATFVEDVLERVTRVQADAKREGDHEDASEGGGEEALGDRAD